MQPSEYDWALLSRFVADTTPEQQVTFDESGVEATQAQLRLMIAQGQALAQKYHAVVTNPPYMGGSGMSAKLSDFVKSNYPDSKSDLFAVCIERGNQMVIRSGINCMVTMQSWMFLSSFEKMRVKTLQTKTITNLMHMENMVMGIAFGTAVTVFRNNAIKGYKGTYNQIKLQDIENDAPKQFPIQENRFAQVSTDNFSKIPGAPVAYWVSPSIRAIFSGERLGSHYEIRAGISSGDNAAFLRLWHEIDITKSKIYSAEYMYTPHNKGGEYRKWYGNREYMLRYNSSAINEMEQCAGFRHDGREYYFKPHVTWSKITSYKSSFRFFEEGFTFDSAGLGLFPVESESYYTTMALMNSVVVEKLIGLLNPTLNVTPIVVKQLPYLETRESTERIAKDCVSLSRFDWDSFETSWDFKEHPLIRWSRCLGDATSIGATIQYYYGRRMPVSCPLELCYLLWQGECNKRFEELKANEEELNRIFIDIYGLQDELTPDVDDKDVTVRKADLSRDIRSLISYAVGCMVGRYSLDKPGLAFAGGAWDASQYVTYPADKDGILPITDDEYFADDIVTMFVNWLKTVYGADTLEENLRFISDALGGKGSPREVIRNYFLNDFYKDHLKIYQKRPIYWLFDSGKKNGFKALVYMHRYQPDTIARVRTDYVHEMQSRYRTAIADVEQRLNDASTSERVKLTKRLNALQAQADELRQYEEKIHHLADQMIAIDLDDGVKVNYAKFADVLATIK